MYLFLASIWILSPGHLPPLAVALILSGVTFTMAFLEVNILRTFEKTDKNWIMRDNEHTCNKSSFLIFKWDNLFDIQMGKCP